MDHEGLDHGPGAGRRPSPHDPAALQIDGHSGFLGHSTQQRPILFGTLFTFTLVGLVMQLVGDLTYVLVDPRIDFETRDL